MYVFFSLCLFFWGGGGGLSCYLSIFFFSFFSKGERDAGGGVWMATKSLFLSGEYLYTFFLIYFILFNSFLPSSLFLLFLCSLIHTFLLFPISSLRFFSRPLLENTHKIQSAIYYKSMTAHIIIVFVLNQALTFGSRRWGLGEGGRGSGYFLQVLSVEIYIIRRRITLY